MRVSEGLSNGRQFNINKQLKPTTRNSVKLALVGPGRWGKKYIETIKQLDNIDLAYIASRNPPPRLYEDAPRVFTNWKKLLNQEIDGLIIATPPHTHAKILEETIRTGIPAIVEKPLALNLEEATKLSDLSVITGVPVLMGHTQLFQPAVEKIQKTVDSTQGPDYILSEGMGMGPKRENVDILWDWSPHDLSLILSLMDSIPKSVYALEHRNYVSTFLQFQNSTNATIHNSNISPQKKRNLTVYCGSKILYFDEYRNPQLTYHDVSEDLTQKIETIALPNNSPLTNLVEYFVNGIIGGDRERFGLELARRYTEVIQAAQISLKRNQHIHLTK